MSVKKPVEITRPIRKLGGDALAMSVRFNYPDGPSWRGNLTVHAETKDELRETLREAYEDKRPRSSVDDLLDEMDGVTDLDFDES